MSLLCLFPYRVVFLDWPMRWLAMFQSKRWRFLPHAARPRGSYSWEAKTAVLDPLSVKAGSMQRTRAGGGATSPARGTRTVRAGRPPAHSIDGGCWLQFLVASPVGPLCGCASPSSAGGCSLSGCTASPEAALLPRTMLGAVGGGQWRRSMAEARGSDVVSSSLRALHKSLERTINESKKDCVRPVKMI